MTVITPKVVQFDDEPAWSVLHRAASLSGAASARTFAADWDLDYTAIVTGADTSHFAEMGGYDHERFTKTSIRLVENERRLGPERMFVDSAVSGQNRICPECIRSDFAFGTGRGEVRAHWRDWWFIHEVTVCPIHKVRLHTIETGARHGRVHETHLDPTFGTKDDPDLMARKTISVATADAEAYIVGRLGFIPPTKAHFLDSPSLGFAISLMRAVGRFHYERMEKMDPDEVGIHEIINAGFAALQTNEGFIAFLNEAYRRRSVRRNHHGPRVVYGSLYDWLKERLKDRNKAPRAYSQVSETLYRHALRTFPLDPGEKFLGRSVEQRNFYTLHHLWKETGMHPTRLPMVIERAGIDIPNMRTTPPEDVFVSATDANRIIDLLHGSMNAIALQRTKGIPRGTYLRLVREGALVPWLQTGSKGEGDVIYLKAEIDAFFDRIRGGAEEVDVVPEGAYDFTEASNRLKVSCGRIIKAILGGDLRCRAVRRGALPWHSILIDVDEANAVIHGGNADEETKPLTLVAATQWLKTTHYVMQSIIDQGFLKVTYGLNKSGARAAQIALSELERFRHLYISGRDAQDHTGAHNRVLARRLKLEHGIDEAIKVEGYPGSSFFVRAEVEAIPEQSMRSALSQRDLMMKARRQTKRDKDLFEDPKPDDGDLEDEE